MINTVEKIISNMTDLDKEIDTILKEGELSLETTILSEKINNFIDRVGDETSTIQQQIYTPVHGLTSEDLEVLAKNINYGWLLDYPIAGKRATLYSVAYYAKKKRRKISDDLLEKLSGLDKLQEQEIAYKLYALGEMKRILVDFFGGL